MHAHLQCNLWATARHVQSYLRKRAIGLADREGERPRWRRVLRRACAVARRNARRRFPRLAVWQRQQFDAVTRLNVMMAVTDDRAAIAGMLGLLRPGGTLILSFPYNENHSVENAYGLPNSEYGRDYRFACRIYSRAHIDGWLREHRGEAIEQDYFQLFSGEFWTVGDRVMPRRVSEEEAHQFTALAMRKTG